MSGLLLPHKDYAPRIAEDAFIAATASIIGDVEIGAGSSVWFGCTLRGDVNHIRIGRRSNLQDGTVVHVNAKRDGRPGAPTLVGDDVTVGHMALIHACTLEDGCFVGMAAVVMDDAVVETGAMVAAGALVTPGKRVRGGELWAGQPAKFVRRLTDRERDEIVSVARHYVGLGADYLAAR